MRRETAILRIDKVKGCVFVNQYLVVKFLGRGACGKVFLCLNTHDLCLYAMKVRAPLWELCSCNIWLLSMLVALVRTSV